jgi:hypothetical protein
MTTETRGTRHVRDRGSDSRRHHLDDPGWTAASGRSHGSAAERDRAVRGCVGSGWGALTPLQGLRFPSPPAEPDVRVSTHPALHEPMPLGYAADPGVLLAQGEGMLAAR